MALARYVALLCVLEVVSTFPSGFWPEYIEDDSTSTNLLDSTFADDAISTTVVSLDAARDDSDSVVDGNFEGETADEATTAATAETIQTTQYSSLTTAVVSLDVARDDESDTAVDENLVEETADETTTVATAGTTSVEQNSSSTTVNSVTKYSTTTVDADATTESQNSTPSPPTKQPPPPTQPPWEKPKKNWAEIFCDKVKQFFNFMGHKITDSVSFIQRLFHWLY